MTTAALPRSEEFMTGALANGSRPRAVGRKFDPSGQPLPFPGNTFLCRIPPDSPGHAALVAAQDRLKALPEAEAFSWLPPSSFHMTVFEGVTAAGRDGDDWPQGINPRASIPDVTEEFLTRTDGLALPQAFAVRPTSLLAATTLGLTGAREVDSGALWRARALLREATGIKRADFIEYRFHITLSYQIRWLEPTEARRVGAACASAQAELVRRAPLIHLGPVEFCSFETMHRFDPLRRFG